MSATIIAVANQKGGTGKTTTCENLGVGLAREGKHVLLVDTDPQASLTIALGYPRPDDLPVTLTDLMTNVMQERPVKPEEAILSHAEDVDLIPASIMLSGLEVSLVKRNEPRNRLKAGFRVGKIAVRLHLTRLHALQMTLSKIQTSF